MLPYTLDNCFTYGYHGGLYNAAEKSVNDRLECSFTRASRPPETFQIECQITAKLLAEQARVLNRTPTILLSGGMDSEVVVQSFIEADAPFELAVFKFKHQLNRHEMEAVQRFCEPRKLQPRFYELDVVDWIYGSEAKQLLLDSRAWSFSLVPHMHLMNQVWRNGGLPILGNGDIYLENTSSGWKYVELEYMLSWYRHAVHNGILGGIGFFQHTPELVLSMLKEPMIEKLGTGRDLNANKLLDTSRYVKYRVYQKYWPMLQHRQKCSGDELVKSLFAAAALPLLQAQEVKFYDRWQVTYTELKAMLST